MLLNLNVSEKSFGPNVLYTGLKFDVQPGEKIGLIGRNGTGKSTLLNLITGDDTDYQGEIELKRNSTIIASRQEHHGYENTTVLDYIQSDLPEFAQLHHILATYPVHMGESSEKMQRYSDALERFTQLGYFQVEDELAQAMEAYQVDPSKLEAKLSELSGGQKRMVELIKVQRARGHLALIDEPTNHMDYVAKQAFMKWLASAPEAVMVITHDRDVLGAVDRIIEIRNGRAYPFKGNYDQYLKINKNQITSQVNEYDIIQRRVKNLRDDLIRFRRLKEKARDPGTIKRFKSQEEKTAAELARLEVTEKPSFWIDRENLDDLTPKLTGAYEKYKARNIQLTTRSTASRSSRLLVEARNLSLGYNQKPLFTDINFSLREGERIRLHGRNGAGKTTLVNEIIAATGASNSNATHFDGTVAVERDLVIGQYEQEIDPKYLSLSLHDAIEQSCLEKDVKVGEEKIKQLLGNYLFNPAIDGDTLIERLSGGQKARFQLIRMLLAEPLLLILDEPTNHLDLPSIEELEDALSHYHGAVIYISHDSYFARNVGGETIKIGSQ
jgi:ATPase subunit of ABC transporter with duplicated ATPase domains